MKNINTVEQFLNPIPKSINLAHKYMTAHFPKLVHCRHFNKKNKSSRPTDLKFKR